MRISYIKNISALFYLFFCISCAPARKSSDSQLIDAQPLQTINIAIQAYAKHHKGKLPNNLESLLMYGLSHKEINSYKTKYLYWGYNHTNADNKNHIILIEKPELISRTYLILLLLDGQIKFLSIDNFGDIKKTKVWKNKGSSIKVPVKSKQ